MANRNQVRYELSSERRRFFLDRGMRKRSWGAGSDLTFLMSLPRSPIDMNLKDLFGDIPFLTIGGVATRAYMPERTTKDIDILVPANRYDKAAQLLRDSGYEPTRKLFSSNAALGLYGQAWRKPSAEELDIISSSQSWVGEAFASPQFDQTGLPVVGLPYLALMKLDAARGVDQGDLTRMLGRLDDAAVEEVAAVVQRHYGDPHGPDDIRQYAAIGRLEWANEGRTSRLESQGDNSLGVTIP